MSLPTIASRILIAALSLVALYISVIPGAAAQAGINGRNASAVDFGLGAVKQGEYRQTGPRQWVETNQKGEVTFRFEETQRDEWSVYLVDRSRNVNIQLDLNTRKVMYSDAGAPKPRPLYDIYGARAQPAPQAPTQAAPPAPSPAVPPAPVAAPSASPPASTVPPITIYGRTATSVDYGEGGRKTGEFRQTTTREWVEMNAAGAVTFRFEETQRDLWSVYLVDRSRNINIQLDLQARKVMYSEGNGPRSALADIIAARSQAATVKASPPPGQQVASGTRAALPVSNGFYVIAHMVNTPAAVDWAVAAGANAAEIDLEFHSTGAPNRFHHGTPCDCSCLAGTVFGGGGGVCEPLGGVIAGCQVSTPATTLLNHVARKRTLAMVIIDSKVGDLSEQALTAAGTQVIALLDKELFGGGYDGVVIVGVPFLPNMPYLRAAVTAANASPNRSRYWFTVDNEYNNIGGVLRALVALPTQNRVVGTGISACSPSNYVAATGAAAVNEREGVSAFTYAWTVDSESSMEAYINAGARGILTNHPARLASVARRKGLQLAAPGTGFAQARSRTVVSVAAFSGTCDCDYSSGGCKISKAAPAGYACKCNYVAPLSFTCSGELTNCNNTGSALCRAPDTSKAACLLGGGDCDGY